MRGGKRAGAGRKAGSATKKTRAIAEKAAEQGITPLQFMLDVMRGDVPKDVDAVAKIAFATLQFEAAKAAAPYIHPRLSSTTLNASVDATPTLAVVAAALGAKKPG